MKRLMAIVVAGMVVAANAGASLIAYWDFADEPGDQESTAGSSVANVAALDLARGSGLVANVGSGSINSRGWHTMAADEDYFTFGFTVASGYMVNLQSLAIRTRSSNTGPGDLGLFYSGDDFTGNLHAFAQEGEVLLDSIIDLRALINLSGTVEFRIRALSNTRADDSASDISSTGTFRIANYDGSGYSGFTGTAIPEPGSFFVLLAAAVVLAFGRCRHGVGSRFSEA